MKQETDYFSEKAGTYDGEKPRVQNVQNIANTILKELSFSKEMNIMDFGSGTGLLLTEIAPYVGKITAVDISRSMNDVLRSKIDDLPCAIEIIEKDLSKETIIDSFDAIISSMTFHHIDNIQKMFSDLYALLIPNGFIAIADLDTEDGSFHKEDTGVFHFGFDRNEIKQIAEEAGFTDVKVQTASIVHKPYGDYPVFLLTGRK